MRRTLLTDLGWPLSRNRCGSSWDGGAAPRGSHMGILKTVCSDPGRWLLLGSGVRSWGPGCGDFAPTQIGEKHSELEPLHGAQSVGLMAELLKHLGSS